MSKTNKKNDRQKLINLSTWQLLPYVALGILIFVANSNLNINYFFRGYLTMIESQIAIVGLYFMMNKIKKKNQHRLIV